MSVFYSFLRRGLSLVLGTALIALGATALLHHLDLLPEPEAAWGGFSLALTQSMETWQSLTLSLGWVLVGALLIALSLAGAGRRERSFQLQEHYHSAAGGVGRISVSEKGLTRLLARAGTEVAGVSGLEPTLRLEAEGWLLDCTVYVWNHASLPQVSEGLNQHLRQALEMHTGLPVRRLDLSIQHHGVQRAALPA